MTTIQIEGNDINAISKLLDVAKNQFHLKIKIVDTTDTVNLDKKSQTKWAEFAEKMDGLFTPDIVEHINSSRKEARDNFIVNN